MYRRLLILLPMLLPCAGTLAQAGGGPMQGPANESPGAGGGAGAPAGQPPGPLGPGGGPGSVLAEGLTDELTGSCVFASRVPMAGGLYPLTSNLFVDPAGRIGLGTTTPLEQLHVKDGDLVVNGGELISTWGGAPAAWALGSPITGNGGAVTLLDSFGSVTATLAARGPIGGAFAPFGWFELLDPSTGDAARVAGQQQSVGAAGQLELLRGGDLRAMLNAINPTGLIDTPQLELWNALGKPTLQLSGSYINGTGRIALADAAGFDRAELSTHAGGTLWLQSPDGFGTVWLSGTSDVQAPQAILRSAEGEDTVVMQDNFEDSGAGRVTLGVSGFGETLFIDGGSDGLRPEVFANQKDGSRAFALLTNLAIPGGRGELWLRTEDGVGGIRLSNNTWGRLTMQLSSGDTGVEVGQGPLSLGLRVWGDSTFAKVIEVADFGGYGGLRTQASDDKREASLSPGGIALFDASDNVSLQWDAETGSKAAVVATESHGRRHLYVREGTGAWFEEAGVAVARGGLARVELDPLFLEVVTVGPEHPLRVFATAHGDCTLTLEVDERGFTARSSSPEPVAFSWVVQAARRGFEGRRLEPVAAIPDPFESSAFDSADARPSSTGAANLARGAASSESSEVEPAATPVLTPVAMKGRRVAPLQDGAPTEFSLATPGDGPGAGGPSAPPTYGPEGPEVADLLRDRRITSGRIAASSLPSLGCLYPISSALYVDPSGSVGFGTASPDHLLTVEGGEALVEGDFSVGLPGSEEVLVREGFDGLPTVELRDGGGASTLTVGLSQLGPGSRKGLELVDPTHGKAVFTSAGTDGIELSDRQTDSTALRFTSDELSAFNQDGVRTLRLQGGADPVEAQLFDEFGAEIVRLDSDPDPGGFGGSRLSLHGGASGALEIGRRVLSADGSQAAGRMAVGDSIELSTSRSGGVADSGSLVVRDGLGNDKVVVDALAPNGGAELVLNDGTDDRVRVLARGDFGAPSVQIVHPGDVVVAKVNGENGAGDAGSLTLHDPITGARVVSLDGDGAGGGGGVFSVFDTNGVELARLDAALGAFWLRYGSTGLTGLRFQGSVLDLMDSSGNVTISYDGQTGDKNGVVATEDHGTRRLHAIESPEVWFEESGSARLAGGSARVELDPIFLETITSSREHPLVVLVTPTAACRGLWVESDDTGFTAHERGVDSGPVAGPSSASFDWRVLARRRGAETRRLEAWTPAAERGPEKAEDF